MFLTNSHKFDGNRVKFILSSGRTGTTQLREYLKKYYPNLRIWFEPPPSRQLYLLWNAEQAGLVPGFSSLKLLRKFRSSRLKRETADRIIEFDSYLSPLICEFIPYVESPCIVHMVRHPYDWIQSMGNFKAASWRKYAVDIVPFTYIIHPEAKRDWRQLDKIRKLAWSWRLVNERILGQKKQCEQYGLFKFEDFTSSDPDVRIKTITSILDMIIPFNVNHVNDIDINVKINKSDSEKIAGWQDWPLETRRGVNDICGRLMETFTYDIHNK